MMKFQRRIAVLSDEEKRKNMPDSHIIGKKIFSFNFNNFRRQV